VLLLCVHSRSVSIDEIKRHLLNRQVAIVLVDWNLLSDSVQATIAVKTRLMVVVTVENLFIFTREQLSSLRYLQNNAKLLMARNSVHSIHLNCVLSLKMGAALLVVGSWKECCS
jgi:hypothetical protein